MLPVVFRIPDWVPLMGGEAITSFGVMLLLAFLAAGALFVRQLRRHRPEAVGWDLVVTAAVAGLIGAKILHLAIHTTLGLPTGGLGRGGLNWFGGLAGGTVAVLWHAHRQELPLRAVAAAAAAPLALGYAIGRLGSFLVGADYGLPTAVPWALTFPAGAPPTTPENMATAFGAPATPGTLAGDFVRVHPTQLYETVLSLGIFGLLLRAGRGRPGGTTGAGWPLFGLYLVLAGAARAAVELVRAKPDVLLGPVTVDLLLALVAVSAGAWLWAGRTPERQPKEVS